MSSGERATQGGRWCLPLAIPALITMCTGAVQAQTIMVRGAAPGAKIEAVVDATPAGSATANPAGEATIAIPRDLGKDKTEANVFVDVCADNLRRVLIVERGKAPSVPGEGCERKDVPGIYWIRHVSTVVVTMTEPPRALLRQGSFSFKPPRVFGPPDGLIVFGGGGLTKVGNIGLFACGDSIGCSERSSGWGGAVGVEYWVKPWLSGEAMYVRPANVTANGSGDNFRFNSVFKADVATVTAKIGIPVARVRMYGKIGGVYHDGTFETDQTTTDRTVTVDGQAVTVKGGRVTYALHTQGWGWTYGGGLEVWLAPRVGLYFEAGRNQLKGKAVEKGEGSLDDHLNYILLGARVLVW